MNKALPILLSLLVFAPPASAKDKADSAKPAKSKIICRKEASTGTRIPQRTCLHADEWARRDAANAANAKDYVKDTVQQSSHLGSPNGG